MKQFTKVWLAFAIFLSAGAFFGLSFLVVQPQFNNLFVGLAGNLAAVALGIVIVNQYLESSARKKAVRALLMLSDQIIADFHNHWINVCWAEFGRDRWGQILSEYVDSKGNPEAIQESVRRQIYTLYTQDSALHEHIRKLDEILVEISRIAGWTLDPSFLAECLKARTAVSKLTSTKLDGSLAAEKAVTEQVLDINIFTDAARQMLMEIAGIKGD